MIIHVHTMIGTVLYTVHSCEYRRKHPSITNMYAHVIKGCHLIIYIYIYIYNKIAIEVHGIGSK